MLLRLEKICRSFVFACVLALGVLTAFASPTRAYEMAPVDGASTQAVVEKIDASDDTSPAHGNSHHKSDHTHDVPDEVSVFAIVSPIPARSAERDPVMENADEFTVILERPPRH